MFDLDQFGLFNKEHGHQVGDEVLKAFADVLLTRFRASDLVARLGGEEFIVVLDSAASGEAVAVSGRGARRCSPGARSTRRTGKSCRSPSRPAAPSSTAPTPTRESLLRTADVALFMAKRAGRDRVVAA